MDKIRSTRDPSLTTPIENWSRNRVDKMENFSDYTVAGISLAITYVVLVKLVVPLVKARMGVQELSNADVQERPTKRDSDIERRLTELEGDAKESRRSMSGVTTTVTELKGLVHHVHELLKLVREDVKNL